MPKDEDILQLVSPALQSEVEEPEAWGAGYGLSPWASLLCLFLRETEKRVEGAVPAWHCPIGDAGPIPGLGLVVASFRAALC